ncbi:bifunctional adenosylcobinamide kinase/adenosylcobinamide-phosphate guanylyltransferase [Sporosarcina sp. G11-34]|uniref:bifunctional adenosylcobinamide kinase/adenosylcobinamide-phosphate guanylyltransferase n=1 Tax=Sporosarcina sp. G11-34 TaxID=2849605 RepID=UPI0022A8F3CD|nr:bifunctional adenosylcobinamide kinase/adenosylcobinamide-phosphate guanylyltransferase [Sporosarcina sp. G11-34]MCZ2260696.1 bifunctional adenosylcobinamide kinase/adenosylcobinamide-phosphate guanylyltransferase [Sporosarcina sp. G11-34]
MHVIIGGAHNGKRAYVKTLIKEQGNNHVQWFEGELPKPGSESVVLAGLEKWLEQCGLGEEEAIARVIKSVENRAAILILTDIGRGIVPIEASQRELRDVCGRLYQRLLAKADEVTRIWYGIAKTIKKRGELS